VGPFKYIKNPTLPVLKTIFRELNDLSLFEIYLYVTIFYLKNVVYFFSASVIYAGYKCLVCENSDKITNDFTRWRLLTDQETMNVQENAY